MQRIRRLLRFPIRQLIGDYLRCQGELQKAKTSIRQLEHRSRQTHAEHAESLRLLRDENRRLRARNAVRGHLNTK